MATTNILTSYGDSSAKESVVLRSIEILTARETQIMNMIGESSAINTIHSYLTDTLETAASAAVAEGGDYTASALTTPTRKTNIVELIAKPFKVTRTQQEISHYHEQNELSRQTEKALMNWANSAEFDLVRSTLVSGASGTAPKMSKISRICYTAIYGKTSRVRMWWHYKKSKGKAMLELLPKKQTFTKVCF